MSSQIFLRIHFRTAPYFSSLHPRFPYFIVSLKLLSLQSSFKNRCKHPSSEEEPLGPDQSRDSFLSLVWLPLCCQRANTCHSSYYRHNFFQRNASQRGTKDNAFSSLLSPLFPSDPIHLDRKLVNGGYKQTHEDNHVSSGEEGAPIPPSEVSTIREEELVPARKSLPFFCISSEVSQTSSTVKQSSPRLHRKGRTIFLAARLEQGARLWSRGCRRSLRVRYGYILKIC